MKIKSLCRMGSKWKQVVVEVLLAPGLPQIQYLGLADRSIKEGAMRVKSAIRRSGFDFPSAQQIIVNISPSSQSKSSTGIDLAVAIGYLIETGQVPESPELINGIVFGELGLDGKIALPADFAEFDVLTDKLFIGNLSDQTFDGSYCERQKLSDFKNKAVAVSINKTLSIKEVVSEKLKFSGRQKDWLILESIGEFHSLLAGPQGAGKSTLIQSLPDFIEKEFDGRKCDRQMLAPHHSITALALIGGGSVPQPGELARAHKGILFLDELLEFNSDVIEGLRRPFDEGQIEISRVGSQALFPCEAIIVGATNLCPCGKWIPGTGRLCGMTRQKCFKHVHRLSGPLLDRFSMIYLFSTESDRREFDVLQIRSELVEIREFINSQKAPKKLLRKWKKDEFLETERQLEERYFENKIISERRRISTLRVAKAIQWAKRDENMTLEHIERAAEWTVLPFERLESSIY